MLEEYAYTLTGNVRTSSNDTETITNTYDSLGRVTQVSESGGVVKNYVYDIGSNRTGFVAAVNNSATVNTSYTYDKLGRLSMVSEGGVLQASYTYDVNGNRASLSSGGVTTTYTYNLANMVKTLTNGNESSYAYEYSLDGNQTQKTDHTGKVTSYIYDGLGRLTSEVEPGSSITYQYDANSNRTQMNNNGAVTTYAYDANNRLKQTSEIAGTTVTKVNYSYDKNGNTLYKMSEFTDMISGQTAAGGLSETSDFVEVYEYDLFNRMTYSNG